MGALQGLDQISEQSFESSTRRQIAAPDQDIIPTGTTQAWQDKTCGFAQPSFGAVARDSVADLA